MKPRNFVVAMATAVTLTCAPMVASPAAAQQTPVSDAVASALPIALWAITGTVLGAVAYPMISSGTLMMAPINSVGALMNPGAAIGTVVGGVGYWMTR